MTPGSFARLLGPWTGAATVLAVVIGAGIFSVPQRVAWYTGSVSSMLVLWVLIGLLCWAAALVWGELGARLPYAGSDFLALDATFGRHVAFLHGWKALMLSNPSNRAALALVTVEYLAVLFPRVHGHEVLTGILILVGLGALNLAGLRSASGLHVFAATIKVAALLGFVLLAFTLGGSTVAPAVADPSLAPEGMDGSALGRFALASLLIFFCYTGWARVIVIAEEFVNPRRSLAKAMSIGMLIAVVLYLLVNLGYLRVLGLEGVRANSAVGAVAVDGLLGSAGAMVFAMVVVLSTVGSMSTSVMACSRLYYAMAKRRAFFSVFATLGRTGVPDRAIILHVVVASIMLILRRNFVDLATSAVFINMIFYALRVASVFGLRRRGIGSEDGFRVPLYPLLPAVVLIALCGLLAIRVVVDWERAWLDLLVLAIGVPASWVWFRWVDHSKTRAA